MGEWVIGAFINLFGSIAINFGTNLLKLGHNERERHSTQDIVGTNGKVPVKPIIYFQTWRVGILFFFLGNCLNFISFGYAAQSLLAALGSIQFVSNIAFAYFVLNKMVTVKVLVATAFIVLGNIFLVAFGNHQSPVYTPEQLAEKYSNMTFLFYCLVLILLVALHHYIYRRGEIILAISGQDLRPYWQMLLPFSYAVVSGAVGSCRNTHKFHLSLPSLIFIIITVYFWGPGIWGLLWEKRDQSTITSPIFPACRNIKRNLCWFEQQNAIFATEEMTRNLKVDPSLELSDSNTAPSNDGSPSDATSCISSAGDATGSVKEGGDMDHESMTTDQAFMMYPAGSYYGYYYPGYDATFGGGSNDQLYYAAGDGTELQYTATQADNGSLIYFMPGIHPAYSPYVPVSMIGVDGQFVAQPPYSPTSVFQPSIPSPGYFPTPLPYGEYLPYPWNPSVFAGDGTHGNGYSGILEIPSSKPNMSSPSQACGPPKKALPCELSKSLETKNSLPTLDVSSGHGMRNQLKSVDKASQHASSFPSDVMGKGYFPFAKFPPYNPGKGAMLYPNSTTKVSARGWGSSEKPKTRSKTNGIDDALPNEQNHGPRTTNSKGSVVFGGNAAGSLAPDGNGNSNSIASVISRDQYNLPDFPTKYNHAFFFVIKSYSEDDIHKSIKYNVWASTPNGNKRLDSAYQDAQQKIAEKGNSCPVFLFFSVNASGQFCGVAEMVGRVDFNKNMDFWQQDKWNGYFPVKWHIIKDVPNPQLRHIILENNENKPVINSRDTQEVKFPQGIEILNIFKNYVTKTSILDDFDFYESRQKVMQEKRPRPFISHSDHKQQKTDDLIPGFQSMDISCTKNMVYTQVGDNTKE